MAWQPGEMVGAYRIEKQLGTGGMATVYKAYHEKLDRYVAIKVMHQALVEDTNFHQRFKREARIVAKLEHLNIIQVFDFNEHEEQPYLVMKYIDGRTLKGVLKEGAMPLAEIRRIMRSIADALDYAHEKGVLHRDIKPSNIIIDTRGTPYITDFGLARIAQSGESTMSADMMLGTPYYISPEQAQGNTDIDHRTDVYSLGIVLYELVVGRVPFASDTPYATVHNHIFSLPPSPRELNPAISEEVELVLLKALAKEPDYRYQSAGEMIDAFEQALGVSSVKGIDENRHQADYSVIEDLSDNRDRTPADNAPVKTKRDASIPPIPEAPQPPKPEPSFEEKVEEWGKNIEVRAEDWGKQIESRAEEFGQWLEDVIENGTSKKRKKKPLTEEERIRRFIKKRGEERTGLIIHLVIYGAMSWFFLSLWGFSGFPWPFFPIFFWGIGIFGHIASYWNKYGPGRDRIERMVQQELNKERERRLNSGVYEKAKNDEAYENLRLTEDGEFTESFIDEIDNDQQQRRN